MPPPVDNVLLFYSTKKKKRTEQSSQSFSHFSLSLSFYVKISAVNICSYEKGYTRFLQSLIDNNSTLSLP
jgi:hypothetical protein